MTIYFEHFFVIENKSITEQIVTHLNKMISFKKNIFLNNYFFEGLFYFINYNCFFFVFNFNKNVPVKLLKKVYNLICHTITSVIKCNFYMLFHFLKAKFKFHLFQVDLNKYFFEILFYFVIIYIKNKFSSVFKKP